MSTIEQIFAERKARLDRVLSENGLVPAETLGEWDGRSERFLFVEAGGPHACRVLSVSSEWWVRTNDNGGFGMSYCCCPSDRLYKREEK